MKSQSCCDLQDWLYSYQKTCKRVIVVLITACRVRKEPEHWTVFRVFIFFAPDHFTGLVSLNYGGSCFVFSVCAAPDGAVAFQQSAVCIHGTDKDWAVVVFIQDHQLTAFSDEAVIGITDAVIIRVEPVPITGYQFPDIRKLNNDHDANWLAVTFSYQDEKLSFKKADNCLLTYELKEII